MESTHDSTWITTGTRFYSSSGYFGTIKYIGQVTGTDGLWYGVEWDDPTRGRHGGVKDGKCYFNCRILNAGSFIRPSAPLSFGRSFLTALKMKYVEAEHGSVTPERVVLGSSNGAIEVEAVGLDKVRRNLGNLDRLREVSLDCELVATGDAKGDILATCPNIRGLDLSASLLATWKSIADIAAELPHLERLALNRNRFLSLDQELPILVFSRLQELQLNSTLTSWAEFRDVAKLMTNLRSVELGHNHLSSLSLNVRSSSAAPELLSLNFEDNFLDDWIQTTESLRDVPSLQQLVLSGNGIRFIPPLSSAPSPLQGVRTLALSRNDLRQWQCMDMLHDWCPNLESLRMVDNPLTEDNSLAGHARQFIIAKIPSLLTLDSTAISDRERTDCELLYLSFISKHAPGSDNEKAQEHPQWIALCNKHGRPAESSAQNERENRLSKYLISVVVQRSAKSPANLHHPIDAIGPSISVKVLKSMKLSILRLKLIKSLKITNLKREAMQVWLKLDDGYVPLDSDAHDLEWYGIENGTHLVVYTGE